MEPYATYTQFTSVYSAKGVSEAEINSAWLPYGADRVNEAFGGWYTIPFSSNNHTARRLSIDFAYLGILIRTRNETDSEELSNQLDKRIGYLTSSGAPMLTDSGESIFPNAAQNNVFDVYNVNGTDKPVFDMRDPVYQRVDPDLIDQNWSDDV